MIGAGIDAAARRVVEAIDGPGSRHATARDTLVTPIARNKHELAAASLPRYAFGMVIIRFDDSETEKKALDYLVGRFSFKTWANGDLMVPEPALGHLAAEGVAFHVKGPASYEHFLPALRNPASAPV